MVTKDSEEPREIGPSEFQSTAECIRSGQVPEPDVIAIMRENPEFSAWYRERYRLDEPPG